MIIYIYSSQPEIAEIISENLTSEANICIPFKTSQLLVNELGAKKDNPNLLILDYLVLNHDLFNVRLYMNEHNIEIPLIFYNDPCLTKSTRAKHWLSQINLLQTLPSIKDFTPYESIFEILQELVESKELSPYIKLMQEPLPIPDYLKKKDLSLKNIRNYLDDHITDFKNNVNLPNNLFYLLKIFQQNQDFPFSVGELKDFYAKDNKSITVESLKVLISKLRGEIEKDPTCKFRIYNNRGLYSFRKINY